MGLFSEGVRLMFGVEKVFEKCGLIHGEADFRLQQYFTEPYPEVIAHYLFFFGVFRKVYLSFTKF